VRDGIIIIRLRDPGNDGVNTVINDLPHHFLDDHGHLLLFDPEIGIFHIFLWGFIENRGKYKFDGAAELPQPDLDMGMVVGQHVSGIKTGKR
jgi:hypothetical protein